MVTIGRLVARKATTQLVDVLAAERRPNAHLLIVGDGPDDGAIRAARGRRSASPTACTCSDRLGEADKYARSPLADVFVSTSQHEGFGLVFLEAMAMRPAGRLLRPRRADRLPATGETGFVVQLNDAIAFAHAVRATHADTDLRRRLRRSGTDSWSKTIFIDSCAARYEAVFEARDRSRAVRSGTRRSP